MKLILAPMEGVVDFNMRQLLTDIGGFDLCVTEFVRIVDQVLSPKVYYRYCPELLTKGRTRAGTPVRVQLLGQDADYLAENAFIASELGSHGIDLNFGCPAKTVNKSKGGAVLLKTPEHIHQIVKKVREAVPLANEVSAKIRLGFDDDNLSQEIFDAVNQAGANTITIHARTKKDGYRPPAYWEKIKPLMTQPHTMQVIANGEVWNLDDYKICKIRSGCNDVMIGRGVLAKPDLAKQIMNANLSQEYTELSWQSILVHIIDSSMHNEKPKKEKYFSARTKQWLRFLQLTYPEASKLFEDIKRLKLKDDVLNMLKKHVNII
ncbi:tRNA dihydrouridine(16) synthase DusC [Pseudoalteromonas sp. NBT06-2]|uniref:tRNA-dihydrouridine synthase n=1 Tax=Pseudoalteromonas sp. NBT06-2 TaxID=2025950 RepID=UPI000BA590B1|nr:tRNA-dihydrouridine synthase [Pseudoalteromonas sp. NBT06-2]PAJ73222.1 tRNA dihydrouridine(16) synthase DusC [Pseudoalteromonas sp. NBT06-2]